jgi:hypothetical protein
LDRAKPEFDPKHSSRPQRRRGNALAWIVPDGDFFFEAILNQSGTLDENRLTFTSVFQ